MSLRQILVLVLLLVLLSSSVIWLGAVVSTADSIFHFLPVWEDQINEVEECGPVTSNPRYDVFTNEVFKAGAVIIETHSSEGMGYGQAYVAVDPCSATGLSIITVEHVVKGAQTSYVTIPTLSLQSEVTLNRYFCLDRWGDLDRTCGFELRAEAAQEILSGRAGIAPLQRVTNHPELKVGAAIASPRPDTGKWTIYQVTDITSTQIFIEAENAGNFCHGRSGSPAILGSFENGTFSPFLSPEGYPISVGELESGNGPSHRDYINPDNWCYLSIIVNRAY